MMKIGVVGSRTFKKYDVLCSQLDKHTPFHVVTGGAIGADSLAMRYAEEHDLKITVYRPEWSKYGARAAFIRNKLIVDNSDSIIAFWDGLSKGTEMTIKIAKQHGKEVIMIHDDCR